MLRFAADENFNNAILRAIVRRNSEIDIVRIQDTEVAAADDPTVLEWVAKENRLLLTHDVQTMIGYAYSRVDSGQPMPGVVEVSREISIGAATEDLLLLAVCSTEGEWEGQVLYIPLR
jgi:hypothetical protein